MAKVAQSTIKYIIKLDLKIDGMIEKPDIIGAIFGQTEGLLGYDLDLRELQRTGRIGRIKVDVTNNSGKSSGEIIISSSLDSGETALMAASLETIERVGPCSAKLLVKSVEDVRSLKRNFVLKRAKEILKDIMETAPDTESLCEKIKEEIRVKEICKFDGLPCGPNLDSDDIIIVEGRADILNMLKYGIKNTIAVNGTSVPDTISKISKEKTTTAFLDGDRGGDAILRELKAKTDLDFISRAPVGKEVEELSKKEIFKALNDKKSINQIKNNDIEKKEITKNEKKFFKNLMNELIGSGAIYLMDIKLNVLGRIPIKEFKDKICGDIILIDGKITKDLIKAAENKNVKIVIGRESEQIKSNIEILIEKDL